MEAVTQQAAERLAHERAAAVARVARLDADLGAMVAASRDSNADDEHDPEGPTIAYERSQLSALRRQATSHLAELDAAIARVADGTYGGCEECGEPISPERLDARPGARTCMRCAQRHR